MDGRPAGVVEAPPAERAGAAPDFPALREHRAAGSGGDVAPPCGALSAWGGFERKGAGGDVTPASRRSLSLDGFNHFSTLHF